MLRYFDAAEVLVSNPAVPLHIFLPPMQDTETFKALSVIATKTDGVDMDTDVFLIRVHPLSVRIVALAVAAVYLSLEREWGDDLVGAALRHVLEKEWYRDNVVWLPREWWNGTEAVFVKPWARSPAAKLLETEKVLKGLDGGSKNLAKSAVYPGLEERKGYWDTITEARRLLIEAKERGHTHREGEYREEVGNVKEWVEMRTWDTEGLRRNVGLLKEKLGIGEIIGFEAVVD
jgi:hypothetical protein